MKPSSGTINSRTSSSALTGWQLPDDEAVKKLYDSDPLPHLQKLEKGTPLPRAAIYHGAVDENVLSETNAIPLAEALKAAGGDVTLELFPGVGHNVYGMGKPIQERLAKFFSTL